MGKLEVGQVFTNTLEFIQDLNYSDEAKAIAWAIKHFLELDCSGVNDLIEDVKNFVEIQNNEKYEKLQKLYEIASRTAGIVTKHEGVINNIIPSDEWQTIRIKAKQLARAKCNKENCTLWDLAEVVAEKLEFCKPATARIYLGSKSAPSKSAVRALITYINLEENEQQENNN